MARYTKEFKTEAVGQVLERGYWSFMIINFLISGGIIFLLYSLLVLIPYLAVTVRRFHDTGCSGWWLFLPVLVVVFFSICVGLVMIGGSAPVIGLETFVHFLLFFTAYSRFGFRYAFPPATRQSAR